MPAKQLHLLSLILVKCFLFALGDFGWNLISSFLLFDLFYEIKLVNLPLFFILLRPLDLIDRQRLLVLLLYSINVLRGRLVKT